MKNPRVSLVLLALLVSTLILVTFLQLAGNAQPVSAQASTHYVSADGDCEGANPCYDTIQAAVDAATNGDTIKVAQGVYTSTGFQVVYISKAITLTGGYTTADWANSYPISHPTVIDAESVARRRGAYIDGTGVATITLAGLTIQRGYAENASGGGVYIVTGSVAIRDSRLLSNTARGGDAFGGGIYVGAGTLILSGSTIRSNSATSNAPNGRGGGIYIRDGVLSLTDCTIQENEAFYYGGGICAYRSIVSISNSTLLDNTANYGGGVHAVFGTIALRESTVCGNSARSHGGAVYVDSCVATLDNNTMLTNTAESAAVLCQGGGSAAIVNNTIRDNLSDYCGAFSLGGNSDSVVLASNVIQGNKASKGRGGAICFGSGKMFARNNTILSNTAKTEGGVFHIAGDTADLHLNSNMMAENKAHNGGVIYIEQGVARLTGNTLQNNQAEESGGAVFLANGTVELASNRILCNAAGSYGSAIAMTGGTTDGQNDVVAGNSSALEGIYISGGILFARHWTLANNGSYALTTNGGAAILTNTVVASHTLGGLFGFDIFADRTLLHVTGTGCSGGASCADTLTGDPRFLSPGTGDYHILSDSAAINVGMAIGVNIDMDGEPRFGAPDVGADEYWAPGSLKHIHLPLVLR